MDRENIELKMGHAAPRVSGRGGAVLCWYNVYMDVVFPTIVSTIVSMHNVTWIPGFPNELTSVVLSIHCRYFNIVLDCISVLS